MDITPKRSKFGFAFTLLIALDAWSQTYQIAELPPLPGHTNSATYAINNAGQAAGESADGTFFVDHAVIWTAGVPTDIQTITNGKFSIAYGLNDSGQATGDIDLRGSRSGVFFWDGTAMQNVTPSEFLREGYAINNSGIVVGVGGQPTDGFKWQNGVYTPLRFLPGHHSARPLAINAGGVIVGASLGSSGRAPVRWIGETPQTLSGLTDGTAYGINTAGQVVGEHGTTGGTRAFLWDALAGPINLPIPSGATSSHAYGINSAGTVIGDIDFSAVVWTNGPTGYTATFIEPLLPLNSGWAGLELYGINDQGQIAGTGGLNGFDRGFILSPASASIRVDLDQTGDINFAADGDRTKPDRRFIFWINHDRDIFDQKEDEQDDADPAAGVPDFQHTKIACARDLEDFVRVHVLAPDGFDAASSSWQVRLSITDVTEGTPAVNVCSAVRTDLSYLTDTNVAAEQVAQGSPVPVINATGIEVARALFVPVGQTKIAPLLLEGRGIGKGALTVQFFKAGTLIASDQMHLDLRHVNTLYDHWTVGDTADRALNADAIPTQAAQIGARAVPVDDANSYFLFVHGWRMQPWERRAFAETAFKRLWHLGYRGGFGFFSWPTEWHDSGAKMLFDLGNYDRSERKAWRSAPALRGLLAQLNHPVSRLNVMAHSMGNIVASEALLLEAQQGSPRRLMRLYLSSQAASVAGAYDAAAPIVNKEKIPDVYAAYPISRRPYFEGFGAAAGQVVNFYNQQDYALTNRVTWMLNQSSKPDWDYGYKAGEFYENGARGQKIVYRLPEDRSVIFAHIAPARSRALGAEPIIAGFRAFDLQQPPNNFTAHSRDHSAQFRSDITRRRFYWQAILDRL